MSDYNGFNGWTNRETWAADLWISNDQGLYESAREAIAEARAVASEPGRDKDDATNLYMLAGALKDWWETLTDPVEEQMYPQAILRMVRDIGNESLIDWAEIASALLSE
jgi:hypothetical protein